MASSSSVVAASSARRASRWKAVANTVTIMIPTAAHVTSHGMIRVSPGSVSPTAAATSAMPRKSWNHRGSDAFSCTAHRSRGREKEQAVGEEAQPRAAPARPSRDDVHSVTLRPYKHVERHTL